MKKLLFLLGMLTALSARAELVQQFKDPTFSGQGWASQVLTLEQMRQGAKSAQESKAAGEVAAAQAAAANTPLAKFMALFTGQVYSQLATQLTNNLFKDCAQGATCTSGNFMVTDTQQIQWLKANGQVTLTVYDGKKDSSGNFVANSTFTQQIVVPISSFSF
jgi:predicted 2-oxoglutarate/Fe(II)-dependent dioxygenase YbiX